MAKKLKILTYPNPILSQKSENVSIPLTQYNIDLIKDMFQTVHKIGVGLAAPQVGENKNIFIIHLSNDEELKREFKNPDFVVINPEIVFYSKIKEKMIEGCLSFPEEYWQIKRSSNIKVKFTTISNITEFLNHIESAKYQKKEMLLKDWVSRIFQHEFDHLNGKLFINMGGIKIDPALLTKDQIID